MLIVEAARDADTQQRSRWAHSELVHLGADVAELIARCRELRAEMMDKGLSAHALGAPIPLVLSKPNDEARRLGQGSE